MTKNIAYRRPCVEGLEPRTLFSIALGLDPNAALDIANQIDAIPALTAAANTGASATFLGADTTAAGNWKGTYGGDGYNIVNNKISYPAYAAVTASGASSWTWNSASGDLRALQDAASTNNRIAATLYNGSTFTLDVNLTDGQSHKVSLYAVDWDSTSRSERIDVLDANGNVLNSQTISAFHGGEYLSWILNGHTQLRITKLAGSNAVVSGLFFGLGTPVIPTSTATFLAADSTTQGNWQSAYGADGYNIINNQASYPAYATVTPSNNATWTWSASTTDPRALRKATTGSTDNIAACWYGSTFTIGVNLTDGLAHQVSLYAVDWDSTTRNERIDILDASGNILNSQTISAFHGGEYLSWTIQGNVQIQFTNLSGLNAEVDGLFFGAAPVQAPPPPPTTSLTLTTRYGNELVITPNTINETFSVVQSGNTLQFTANGQVVTAAAPAAGFFIYGQGTTDSITLDSSITVAATVVTLDGSADSVISNDATASIWVDGTDTFSGSGTLHRINAFYQPWTTNVNSFSYIPLTLGGQTLPEPTDAGSTYHPTGSLWGTGPTGPDMNQRSISDCYFLAPLQSLAVQSPARLKQMAVDLGDGTYAVQFDRGGTYTYVRIDGNFSSSQAVVGPSGNLWALAFEKAYAYFRTGANTYASLNIGNTGNAAADLGIATSSIAPGSSSDSTLFNLIKQNLVNSKIMIANTGSVSANLIVSHSYSVVATSTDANGNMFVTLRNPWGFDGTGSDSNPNDGLVKVSLAIFKSNITWMYYAV